MTSVGGRRKIRNPLDRQSNQAEVRRTVLAVLELAPVSLSPCITIRSRGTKLTGTFVGPITRSPREGSNFGGPGMTSRCSPEEDFQINSQIALEDHMCYKAILIDKSCAEQ